jgi:hypothetical protein
MNQDKEFQTLGNVQKDQNNKQRKSKSPLNVDRIKLVEHDGKEDVVP